MIDVGVIGQKHIGKGALVLIVAVCLDGHVLPKGEGRSGMLSVVAVGLAFPWAVDAAEADTFGVVVVQGFDGVAVEGRDPWLVMELAIARTG